MPLTEEEKRNLRNMRAREARADSTNRIIFDKSLEAAKQAGIDPADQSEEVMVGRNHARMLKASLEMGDRNGAGIILRQQAEVLADNPTDIAANSFFLHARVNQRSMVALAKKVNQGKVK